MIEPKNQDAFLTKKMYGLLKSGNFLKVPTLMGFNSEESLYFNKGTHILIYYFSLYHLNLHSLNLDPNIFKSSMESWDKDLDIIVPDDMHITDKDSHTKMSQSIRDIYTGGQPFANNLGAGIRVR